ncbi:hypothetical protein MUK42_24395 [Musa troglodytarum]|uniref:Uncharacterized protein n=1 Tax=Musa troglodytarum TaxID=320322 RepID=A0A9E7G609_9LILI|nr:hypothetical protein MUK42_24395 [Musa troglodytarum]
MYVTQTSSPFMIGFMLRTIKTRQKQKFHHKPICFHHKSMHSTAANIEFGITLTTNIYSQKKKSSFPETEKEKRSQKK